MRSLGRLVLRISILLLLFPSFTVQAAPAQSAKPSDDKILRALLNEVRLLRETLEQVNTNALRGQILVERIRAQNDKVTRLTRMLEDARDSIADAQAQLNQFNEQSKLLETQIENEFDSNRRSQLEQQAKEFKYMLGFHKQRLDRLREREARLAAELQTEQDKLAGLENRLEGIEHEIEDNLKEHLEDKEKVNEKKDNAP
jgi:predicted  nucleic acid-binding Zn-ribbon protein